LALRTKGKPAQSPPAQLAEVFIASSGNNLDLAKEIKAQLDHTANVVVWNQGVAQPSTFFLEQLFNALDQSDFGVFVFAPDDITKIKGKTWASVRDNVVFELGLFMGKLGHRRCFIVAPEGMEQELRLPSDLFGLTFLRFKRSQSNATAAVGTPCFEIQKMIKKLGIRARPTGQLSDNELLQNIWMKVSGAAPISTEKLSTKGIPTKRIGGKKDVRG
jgi:predicted nucleotide-binding protein